MIRPARVEDVPRLRVLAEEMLARSRHRHRWNVVPALVTEMVVKIVGARGKGAIIIVGEHDGLIESFIIGLTARFYGVSDKLFATDRFIYATEAAPATDLDELWEAFVAWGRSQPGVIEIMNGATDAIIDYRRMEKFYQRKGMKQSGVIYRMETPQ